MSLPLFLTRAGAEHAPELAASDARCGAAGWSAALWAGTLAQDRVYVLRHPRQGVAAFCAVRRVADEAEILTLGVDPSWRRRGLARWLLGVALRQAARAGARMAFLEVREGNATARSLYAEAGFATTGRRRGYYRDPPEDAVLMVRGSLD